MSFNMHSTERWINQLPINYPFFEITWYCIDFFFTTFGCSLIFAAVYWKPAVTLWCQTLIEAMNFVNYYILNTYSYGLIQQMQSTYVEGLVVSEDKVPTYL